MMIMMMMKTTTNISKKTTIKEKIPHTGDTESLNRCEYKHQYFFLRLKKKSILNDSLFLGLYELVHKCTSPTVQHLPRVDLPQVQSGTTPYF